MACQDPKDQAARTPHPAHCLLVSTLPTCLLLQPAQGLCSCWALCRACSRSLSLHLASVPSPQRLLLHHLNPPCLPLFLQPPCTPDLLYLFICCLCPDSREKARLCSLPASVSPEPRVAPGHTRDATMFAGLKELPSGPNESHLPSPGSSLKARSQILSFPYLGLIFTFSLPHSSVCAHPSCTLSSDPFSKIMAPVFILF